MDTPTFTHRADLPRPLATVDVALLTIDQGELSILLGKRAHAPFAGVWGLPGAFIDPAHDTDVAATAGRVLRTKIGLESMHLEQLATFSGPARDPDGWSISVAHLGIAPRSRFQHLHPDTALFPVKALPPLAFDHRSIVETAVERVRGKGAYSTLPAGFLEATFTLPELEQAYEIALGAPVDTSSFRRKIKDLDLIEEVGTDARAGRGRPAMRYRLKQAIGAFNRTLATQAG